MWVHKGRLPVVLESGRYVGRLDHDREIDALFVPGWHCVGSLDDCARPGDFFTTELFDRPILVRNAGGEPRAFLNVCAHRHSLLTHEARGRCARMRCQLHGWEYDDDGWVCKIPDARSFAPVPRGDERERLRRLRVEARERLLFVSLSAEPPPLDEALGEATLALVREGFGPRYRQIARWEVDHPANWKVTVENAIESYHVPMVHPGTLVNYGPEEGEDHVLADGYTSHRDTDDAGSIVYRTMARALRRSPLLSYRHHHAFPSMMLALTDIMSFLQVIVPTSPTTSKSIVHLFVYRGDPGRVLGPLASRLAALFLRPFVRRVLEQDRAIQGAIQRGLASPDKPGPGSISGREERIYAFQRWVSATVK